MAILQGISQAFKTLCDVTARTLEDQHQLRNPFQMPLFGDDFLAMVSDECMHLYFQLI